MAVPLPEPDAGNLAVVIQGNVARALLERAFVPDELGRPEAALGRKFHHIFDVRWDLGARLAEERVVHRNVRRPLLQILLVRRIGGVDFAILCFGRPNEFVDVVRAERRS